MVLSDSSDDESAQPDQPTGGDADASSSRGLEEEERHACLQAERLSKFNDKRASRRPKAGTSHDKKPAGEPSVPPPPASRSAAAIDPKIGRIQKLFPASCRRGGSPPEVFFIAMLASRAMSE
jgi:hypothetical protein